MVINRREFGKAALAVGLLGTARGATAATSPSSNSLIKPPRLRPGDTVGLVNPSAAAFETEWVDIFTEQIELLGVQVRRAPHFFDRRGYLAGSDEDRAADFNSFFSDKSINAIIATGGWGAARILSRIDYDAIRRNPKILIGYSDITSLLLAIHAKTGLVTFHGPHDLNPVAASHLHDVTFAGKAVSMRNPRGDAPVQLENRIRTITPGRARGRILGGNLTVLTTIMGSSYLPNWKGSILFVEDVREKIYKIDRMFTQLKLAGVLDQIAGFVFGQCVDCDPGEYYGSLTLEDVLQDHIAPLGVPAWHGAMIGHIDDQFTIPEGIEVEIDADAGIIQMLESAVS
jgi:muramoyltetrapeptide carboxypeptidase